MKPDAETLRALLPDLEAGVIDAHLERLDESYFERFPLDDIARHVGSIAALSAEQPVKILVHRDGDAEVSCTVLAFDYLSEFALITGVLAWSGLSILSGDIFTYGQASEPEAGGKRRAHARYRPPKKITDDPLRRRKIIDHFSGSVSTELSLEAWEQSLNEELLRVILLLEKGDTESVAAARHHVNELVTQRLAELKTTGHPVLFPVELDIDNDAGAFTRLKVISQDTPAFLYAMTNALFLQGLYIERVRIRTIEGRIEDEFDIVDASGQQVVDEQALNKIKLAALLTKQFTYFLNMAPDPYTALSRFEHMVEDIIRLPETDQWMDSLTNSRAMEDLARVLGASDYLWEDFIRLQYESLMPILQKDFQGRVSQPVETIAARLEEALSGATTLEEQRQQLNAFKDQEIFHIDLDHILAPDSDFRVLAEHLTVLAEHVVRQAARCVYEDLVKKHGTPRTVAGLETSYAVLGLGKMGGAALGYASDVELLFVYGDNGKTDGKAGIGNEEFFSKLVLETANFIEAKREGIFRVDLRLRPYGNSGPKACSLENFIRYYGPSGPAHSYERLALVRMRAVGGDAELGGRVERLRDDFIYATQSIDTKELRDLREKQFEEKKKAGAYNAKFSPGALVDLEYATQILQVMHARDVAQLRTPRVHEALDGLTEAGILHTDERERLIAAYDFLRDLINALRMLRGSAKDLFLPPVDSHEFLHLARRMGYTGKDAMDPAQQLYVEFQTRTAAVRAFVERHFGRESLPGPVTGNMADLVLSKDAPAELRDHIFRENGFTDSERGYRNLKTLAKHDPHHEIIAPLAVLACDVLRGQPDQDMALNNWERFAAALADPKLHFEELLSQPKRLEILMSIFSRSQFLSDTLIRHPEFSHWAIDPELLNRPYEKDLLIEEVNALLAGCDEPAEWLNTLRKFRKREMLRIGTRDMCLFAPMKNVMRDLSTLADTLIELCLDVAWSELEQSGRLGKARHELEACFCVMAFGKLGGHELNYSSDIDLIGVYDEARAERIKPTLKPSADAIFSQALEKMRHALSTHTDEGHAYRVDFRLRPYGSSGQMVSSLTQIEKYYREAAGLWEFQALLKLRPVAGNAEVGQALLEHTRPMLVSKYDPREVRKSIRHMRDLAVKMDAKKIVDTGTNVKSGIGGIRDIEFLAQGLQLMHVSEHPELVNGNTLEALVALASIDIIPEDVRAQLADDYTYLRRVEHFLQILEDRQIHAVPSNAGELEALAKRMHGTGGSAEAFTEELHLRLARVHDMYATHLLHETVSE